MLLPALNSARATARKSACMNNYKSIGTAMSMYVDDSKGFYPLAAWLSDSDNRHIWTSDNPKNPVTFIAPYLKHTIETAVGYVRINGGTSIVSTRTSPLACPDFDQDRWRNASSGASKASYASNNYIFDPKMLGLAARYQINFKNPYHPSRVMMSLESTGNKSDGFKSDVSQKDNFAYRHSKATNVLFFDGHVATLQQKQIPHGDSSCPGYVENSAYTYFWRGRNEKTNGITTFDVKTY